MNKAGWDEELQGSSRKQWNVLVSELASFKEVRVPSCYFLATFKTAIVEIHGFSDASERAYRISSNIRLASITGRPLIDAASIYIEMTIYASL